MSDEIRGTTNYVGKEILARFILEAAEHINHTGARTATLLFTDQPIADATCIGVDTAVIPKRITDQRTVPPERHEPTEVADQSVLDVVISHGPINVRRIGDLLGIPSEENNERGKIRRILVTLGDQHLVRKGHGRYPDYTATAKGQDAAAKMPIRPTPKRNIRRRDITEDKVVAEFMRMGRRTTSKAVGDAMGIPRPDNTVRSKITELVRKMCAAGRMKDTGIRANGGRLYELIDEASQAAEA